MKVAVIGTGYVGLVTGTCFADSGNDVTCVDIDNAKIDALEPRSDSDLRTGTGGTGAAERGGWPTAFHDRHCVRLSSMPSVIYLAVGTPQGDDGAADLSALWTVAESIAPHLRERCHRGHQEHRAGRHERANCSPS